ncbi:Gamma-tubulin complex component 3, partial [Xenoophorus captivus]
MASLDQKSPNVLLQSLCCRITGKSEADVAHQFQYAVRVIGSNYAPTIERDEFLVSEKIKKELLRQRREADAALFSELHRKLQTQGVLKHRWSVLYLLLSLSEDPRKPSSRVGNYGALFAQALPRDAHSTPFYCTRPQSLALGYGERSAGLSGSIGTSGVSSLGVYTLNGPTPTPPTLLAGQPPQSVAAGTQSLGSRLAWALPINSSPSATMAPPSTRPPFGPQVPAPRAGRPRRDGDAAGEVSEAALVRDILYVFQGIDGKFIKMSAQENCYKIDSK